MATTDMLDQRVARLAYQYWEERGRPLGSPDVDWYRAADSLRSNDQPCDLSLSAVHVQFDTAGAGPAKP
jgi:hypothetical protein